MATTVSPIPHALLQSDLSTPSIKAYGDVPNP